MILSMKINRIKHERVQGVFQGETYDIDRYMLELKSPMSTQEFTVVVSQNKKEISGDVVRYGTWEDLSEEELLELLSIIEKEGKLFRPYTNFKFK